MAVPLVYTPTGLGLYADTVFDTNFNFNAAGSSPGLRLICAWPAPPSPFISSPAPIPRPSSSNTLGSPGRPENPPLWTFGPWITALQGRDAVLEEARKNPHRRHPRQRTLGL